MNKYTDKLIWAKILKKSELSDIGVRMASGCIINQI